MRVNFISHYAVKLLRKTLYGRISTKFFSSKVLHGQDTIFALSSGQGKAGIAIIRVSGPSASNTLVKLSDGKKIPAPQRATLRKIVHPQTQEQIDKGIVLWFPGPRSFTGEDCAELHVHGGPAIISALLSILGRLPGLRHAEAGEFTKRAFMNGKLDLTGVEGLADLISAETEAQRKQALRQLDGDLCRIYTNWRSRLIKCLANSEAYIDFHEEENIEDDVLDTVDTEVKSLLSEISSHLNDNRQGERLRSGVHVVIIGQPNVGKSSLLNCVCQRPAAIVSPTAGTTRDIVETAVNLAGYPILLSDTAGLREAENDIEMEGIRRAMSRADNSDIKVILLNAPDFLSKDSNCRTTLHRSVTNHLLQLGFAVEMPDKHSSVSQNINGHTSHSQDVEILADLHKPHALEDTKAMSKLSKISHVFDLSNDQTNYRHFGISRGLYKSHISEHSKSISKVAKSADFLNLNSNQTYNENSGKSPQKHFSTKQTQSVSQTADKVFLKTDEIIIVFNKCDLLPDFEGICENILGFSSVGVSCVTGTGITQFIDLLTDKVKEMCWDPQTGSPSLTQARHRTHLTNCVGHLESYQMMCDTDIVLAAQQLRKAMREIGKVIGKVSSEDILNVIFSDFCIGK